MHMELHSRIRANERLTHVSRAALILIAIKDYTILSEMYGHSFIDQLEHELKETLEKTLHENRECCSANVFRVGPGEYSFIIQQNSNPADIAYKYKLQAQDGLKATMFRQTGLGIDLGMGYSAIETKQLSPKDPVFVTALDEARRLVRIPLNMKNLSVANSFQKILTNRLVTTLYQPILDFRTGTILGWESLSRGPKDSSFRSPVVLFETAEQLGRLFALEKVCRESAIKHVGKLASGEKLFLNIHPKTMADPEFTPGNTIRLLEEAGMSPDNIVFEITERHSVQEFDLFYRTLDHYRSQGFKVAVDDAGAGYAGLTTIAELQPDFIKLDKSLITNIHKDPVKRALVETTVTFADKIGSKIIGEGVELKEQAICLKDIGVHCGQGYFLARPDSPKPDLTKECMDIQSVGDITSKSISCSQPVGDLAKPPHSVKMDYLVSDAQDFFKKNDQFTNLIVIKGNIPQGLVMEYHLNRQLSSQYGIALFYKRSIDMIMDDKPLIVDIDMPMEQVARHAMKREPLKAYDDIIVTRKDELYGFVSVQNLLNAMAKIQVEMAKGTNPLTGLPGNVSVEQEVESRIAQNRNFSIIYADLDHFKVYNDTYGFKNGDHIIRLAADVLSWATRKHAGQDACLCH